MNKYKFTPNQEPTSCPRCGSNDTSEYEHEYNLDRIWTYKKCEKCGFLWDELYWLSFDRWVVSDLNDLAEKLDRAQRDAKND